MLKYETITTIINYCSNDYQFLRFNVQQAAKFSRQILIPVCDHFYDGSLENQTLINQSIQETPEAEFIKFKYDPRATFSLWRGWQFILRRLGLGRVWGPQCWICLARQLGLKKVKPRIDYVLFLDADEVVDGKRFLAWLNTKYYQKFNALKPAAYWYWRSPSYQADVWEDNPLLACRRCLKTAVFLDHDERNATYNSLPGPKQKLVLGLDNKPMIHHYGWAKPKKNLLKKVQTWGHTKDRNWEKLIETEFSHPFSGTDFIYERKYKTIKPFIKL